MEFGLDTFGDITRDATGALLPQDQVLRNVVAEAVLADQVGVDAINLGEHHRDDFAISAPEILLANIAARTARIRLGTAVTVLSTDDPIRLYQRFSTLNALAEGRGEIILGRGSFTESYPLFGYDMRDYELLFEEKLAIFAQVNKTGALKWEGEHRAPVSVPAIYPPAGPGGIRSWIGVGGSPESVVRAVRHDMPMMLAIIGGDPRRFLPFVKLYHDAAEKMGKQFQPLGVHSPGLIAETDEAARESAFTGYKALHDRIGRERGWPPITKQAFLSEVEGGSQYVGSPETVAQKIAATVRALGLQRFSLKYSAGTTPHEDLMRSVELYGTQVIPRVRELLA
ncbi:MAG: LLM class flavin-dependent oxidoreductase [Gemmobacter sp.]|uniref:LLM class flavin-dependent oxidoreductase n=1 Tax=Gemmobacter sp. TaxID=1898957 RepID=UPI001A4073C5|nr:LLM class flavin-dependent oxidoreductase [Gemmobacter sp.]MBL8563763.1 LLM class flavin-dependent oxidoreductase [Gemmobacter sp.]